MISSFILTFIVGGSLLWTAVGCSVLLVLFIREWRKGGLW